MRALASITAQVTAAHLSSRQRFAVESGTTPIVELRLGFGKQSAPGFGFASLPVKFELILRCR